MQAFAAWPLPTKVRHLALEAHQDGAKAFDISCRAAGEDGEMALFGAGRAASQQCIHPFATRDGESLGHAASRHGVDSGVIRQDQAALSGGRNALLAEDDRFKRVVVCEADTQHIHQGRQLGRCGRQRRARGDQAGALRGVAIPDTEIKAGFL